jgi:glycosyltransferase involved in cell wall biosynthesis
MKIGLFTDTYTPQINGVATVVQMMRREFRAMGHDAYIFAPSYPDQSEEGEAGKVWRFPSRKVNFHPESRITWPYRRKVPRVLSELDIVHSHTPFTMGLLGVYASRRNDLPHVHTYHTFFTEYRHYFPRAIRPTKRMTEKISRAFCNRCHYVLTPSDKMRDELGTYDITVPIRAMPFGIDLDTFQREPKWDVKAELGLPDNTRILLTAGRLGEEKNFGFVIESFVKIHEKHPDTVLVIGGDGPARESLENQARMLGIKNAVHFLGYVERDQLVDCYLQSDLFVFASKTETQGIVVLEAQAAGVPVVAIGEMGVLDVVDHGQSGLLVSDNVDEYADAADSILSDSAIYDRYCQGALDLAERHSARRSCEDLIILYEELLKQPALSSL